MTVSRYHKWMISQPAAFQDDVLGKEQAELLRSGQLILNKFVDSNPEVLSLEELKGKESAALERDDK